MDLTEALKLHGIQVTSGEDAIIVFKLNGPNIALIPHREEGQEPDMRDPAIQGSMVMHLFHDDGIEMRVIRLEIVKNMGLRVCVDPTLVN